MSTPGSSTLIAPGSVDTSQMSFAVAVSRFNAEISEALLDGARRAFTAYGVADSAVTVVHVPGAFELPLAASALITAHRPDAVICLGAVIRGETAHFEFVAGECARGVQRVALDSGVPVIFGVLTTGTIDQARARSGSGPSNKGFECVAAAIEMAAVLDRLRRQSS